MLAKTVREIKRSFCIISQSRSYVSKLMTSSGTSAGKNLIETNSSKLPLAAENWSHLEASC